MRTTQKILMISLACVGGVVALLLTAVLTSQLIANREMVKSFIVDKTAQATGGKLDYDRLDVSFFPLPHLKASGIQLHRPEAFELQAQALSIYPRLLAILTGRLSIRRLVLTTPDTRFRLGADPLKAPSSAKEKSDGGVEEAVRMAIGGLFNALATIDPGTDLRIEDGSLTLAFSDAPDLQIDGIDAYAANDSGNLLINMDCRSELTGELALKFEASIESRQASGQISISDISLGPLLAYAPLPADITVVDSRTAVEATIDISSPETVQSRFDLRFPSLTVTRKGHRLDLETVVIAGSLDYADKKKVFSFDTLQSAKPPLNLSATAAIAPAAESGRALLEINADTGQIDIAVASQVTRDLVGDLKAIRTAFNVAKQGILTDVTYFAAFDVDPKGWQQKKMKAAGHIAQGLVTIPGIEADLERMDGDVAYEDRRVVFKQVSGHFKGATFERLESAIDWERASTLTIACPSAVVDAAPMYTWLTGFKGLDKVKNHIESVTGKATLSNLEISGPLTKPSQWSFNIVGTPQALRLKSPLVPFEVNISGGQIVYIPGKEHASDVRVEFLDGSFVASGQTKGIINPESATLQVDGSMGQVALDWLGTILPIPEHLQIKPPLDLTGVNIVWDNIRKTVSLKGEGKSAGGVVLFTDFTYAPEDLEIRKLQFSDGHSKATGSARIQAGSIDLAFAGNIESQTADRLLRDNRTLSGRLEGDFRSLIDTAVPLNSTFTGKLSGEGLHLQSIVRDPIEIKQFAVEGHDNHLKISPSKVSLLNSQMVVDGLLKRSDGNLVFDLNVNADRLDEALIRSLQPAAEDNAESMAKQDPPAKFVPRGDIHLNVTDFTYHGFTWSPLEADVRIDDDRIQVRIDRADLCGISTTGEIDFSPRGLAFSITPEARGASLQQTDQCLWQMPIEAEATFDLTGVITLPPTREQPLQFMSGQLDVSSQNGRIMYGNVTTKVTSYLEATDAFASEKFVLEKEGLVYETAHIKAEIRDGKLLFDEIIIDGTALKLTGRGSLDLQAATADIILLAAPLKTVDRIVNKIPVINYIAGGSLISIPIRIRGKWNELRVRPMRPADVGQGVVGIMKRTLKAPFKLVEGSPNVPAQDTTQKAP